jgi:glycine/D-amino acid oxidase-like deaminating enzyme/nitrite reductase/ring-hydroxylating ferredoxin subunit
VLGPTESYWVASQPGSEFPTQSDDVAVDVAVVGAGIVGVVLAWLLKQEGLTVALLDARRPLQGTTGHTTAKLTSSHSVIYTHLVKSFGVDGARIYGEANEAGIDWVAQRVSEGGIDCGFERRPNYVYTEQPEKVEDLREEAKAATRAGLPASFETEIDLPFPVLGAVRFENQAQFHPRAFLLSLLGAIPGDGSQVFAHTPATGLDEDDPCRITTPHGTVTADAAVIATHMPVFDRALFFAKAHPYNSYVVAGSLNDAASPGGMYISSGGSTRSIRTIPTTASRLLLLSGAGHHVGSESDTSSRYRELVDFGRRWWGVTEYPYRWSTHDYVSIDKVPFIGRLRRTSNNVYVATGFGKWGMAAGVAAALLIQDHILGRPNPWAGFFDAQRVNVAQAKDFVFENSKVGAHFFLGRLPKTPSLDDIRPDSGAVVTSGFQQVAAYRDEDGTLHRCSAVCTHLKCIVNWNDGDKTWDCPCHGSRYDRYGKVIHGPANRDLRRIDT